MIRKLKMLALALVAACALTAMVASAASAAEFTVASAPATVKAIQTTTHKFTITAQTFTCSTGVLAGSSSATTFTSIKMAAEYSGCKTQIGTEAQFTGFAKTAAEIGAAGKCWFRFDAAGSVGLECNGGDVTMDMATCVVHIPAQSFASGFSYTDNSAGNDLDMSFNVTGIKGSHTDGFLCPFGSGGESASMIWEGAATTIASSGGGVAVDLTFDK